MMTFPIYGKNIKCSKPPTSDMFEFGIYNFPIPLVKPRPSLEEQIWNHWWDIWIFLWWTIGISFGFCCGTSDMDPKRRTKYTNQIPSDSSIRSKMVDLRHPDDPTIIQKVADWSIVSSCTATHASTNRQTDIPAGLMLTIPIIYIYSIIFEHTYYVCTCNIHLCYFFAS